MFHTMLRHLFVNVQEIMTLQIEDCCHLGCDTASPIRSVAVFQMIVLPPVTLVLQDPDAAWTYCLCYHFGWYWREQVLLKQQYTSTKITWHYCPEYSCLHS
jgi:hypothetical protein